MAPLCGCPFPPLQASLASIQGAPHTAQRYNPLKFSRLAPDYLLLFAARSTTSAVLSVGYPLKSLDFVAGSIQVSCACDTDSARLALGGKAQRQTPSRQGSFVTGDQTLCFLGLLHVGGIEQWSLCWSLAFSAFLPPTVSAGGQWRARLINMKRAKTTPNLQR